MSAYAPETLSGPLALPSPAAALPDPSPDPAVEEVVEDVRDLVGPGVRLDAELVAAAVRAGRTIPVAHSART